MSYEFEPMDLDKDFIDDIYEEALTDEKRGLPVEVLGPTLVKNRSGKVFFSVDAIIKYSEYIDYLFGQLIDFHNPSNPIMAFDRGFVDYMCNYWTENMNTVLELYALGITNGSISPFVRLPNGLICAKKDSKVIPTLNTEDPKFDEWFENVYKKQHKPRFRETESFW